MQSTTFEQLWQILPRPSPEHVARLLARRGDKLVGDFARNPQEIQRFTESCKDMNCYISLNPTTCTTGIRHTGNDVTHWSFLPIDIDPVEEVNNPHKALSEVMKIVGGYTGYDLFKRDLTVIDSGRGLQIWLRLTDMEFSETSWPRSAVRRMVSYWLGKFARRLGTSHGCRIDTSVSDLPRVMRCPGTFNWKTGQPTRILSVQKDPFPWLYSFLCWGTPAEVINEPEVQTQHTGTTWQSAFNRMTRSAQEYLTLGKEEPGRHKVMWHTARSFFELGICREEARKALNWANSRQGKDQILPSSVIEHALDTSYGRVNV